METVLSVSETAPVPVVVGVGQVTHRDDDDPRSAEPLAAHRRRGAGGRRRRGWRSARPGRRARPDAGRLVAVRRSRRGLVADRLALDVSAARRRVHATGGETPIRGARRGGGAHRRR